MQDSNAVVKKIYCIVINGKIQEKLSFKNMEIVRTMIKKERERQIKKAYIFYRRRVKTLLATGRYLLTIDYRKKDINNEK
jgi:hypothetical protein